MRRKIIFVNRYFYPDMSATSQILSDLAFDLAREGLCIHVVSSRLQYSDEQAAPLPAQENIDGVNVIRCWSTRFGRGNLVLRSLDYLSFYLSSLFVLLRICSKGDILVAKTDPPLISVVALLVVKIKRGKLVNWLQDLFPEVATGLGVARESFLVSILKKLRNKSLTKAERNIVIGERMRQLLIGEGIEDEKILTINNWSDSSVVYPVNRDDNELREAWGLADKFVIGYSGNLGRAHDVEAIVYAASQLSSNPDYVFLFIGGGAKVDELKLQAKSLKLENIHFRPYQPRQVLAQSLSVPDVHLISLQASMEGLIVPSKFYGIAAAGRASIFIGDPDGEIPGILAKHSCGITVPDKQIDGLPEVIAKMNEGKIDVDLLGRNAVSAYVNYYDRPIAVTLWKNALEVIEEN